MTQQVASGAMVATVAEPAAPQSADASAAFIDPIRIPAIEPPPILISPLAPLPELSIAPLSPQRERD